MPLAEPPGAPGSPFVRLAGWVSRRPVALMVGFALVTAIAGAYAGHLVPREQLAKAVAVTSMGGTTAFVLGVPVGTAIGQALGWRAAFGIIAASVVVLALLVVRFLPGVDHRVSLATGEVPLPARRDPTFPGVLFVCLLVAIIVIGHNVFYTYIAPYIIDEAGFPRDSVSVRCESAPP